MRRRPQRPDRIIPPGWHDWDDDEPEPIASPVGCVLMAIGIGGLAILAIVLAIVAWWLVM